ncbi:hypothetical protein C7B76_16030 [filamentous cyanobacterium CCP2]|nr:hypothetical protein C7B76_16030 [filamentous cyanobacterium CCP2]
MYPFAVWDAPTRSVPSFSRRNALKLARQGNAKAISTLMNYSLKSRGIMARASLQEGCLWIVLEGKSVPPQKDMMRFVYSGIFRLELPELKVVRVYGMRVGQTLPAWSEDILLGEPSDSSEAPAKEQHQTGISPLQVEGSAQPLQNIYSKLNSASQPGSFSPAQHFANSSLSDLLGDPAQEKGIRPDRTADSPDAAIQKIRLSFPLAEPVPSQLRLMALLKVLCAIAILVAAGSLLQVVVPLKGLPGMDDPLMIRVVGSATLVGMSIAAWIALICRTGIDLHPKYAQRAYIRLGFAFLVNVGCALLLMLLFGRGILTPSPQVILPLFALCVGLWMMGCASLSKAKGYHPLWGIVGLLLLDGAVLLSLFPDRSLSQRRANRETLTESIPQ